MKYYLIIDIGGTKTTSVVFNDQGEPITEFKVKKSRTYEGEDAVFQNTIELAYEVLEEAGKTKEDLAGVGVAAPGPLDYRTGLIIDVPMMGWKNFPLGDRLKEEFGVPVYVENDGNLGALAEANSLSDHQHRLWRRYCHRRRDLSRTLRICRRVRTHDN